MSGLNIYKTNGRCSSMAKCSEVSRLFSLRSQGIPNLNRKELMEKGKLEDKYHGICETLNYSSCITLRGFVRQ
jgi:hypothetical protein